MLRCRRAKDILLALTGAAALLCAANVAAQTPARPTPGSVGTQVDRPVIAPEAIPEAPIERPQEDTVRPPSSSMEIVVDRFVLTGNTLFDDAQLLEIIAEYTGKPITLEGIYEAADAIQRFYRREGYLLASVYVPAQKVTSGTVRLEVIEGRISGIRIEGELDSYDAGFLIDLFGTEKLGEIVSQQEMEERILMLNDLPGLRARTIIVPGDHYGTSDVIIEIEEDRSTVVLRANNYGRVSLGEARLEAGWLYVNLLAQGDQLNLSGIVAEDSLMTFVRIDYDLLLNRHGTRAGGNISAFDYDVDTDELDLTGELGGDGNNFRIFINHPMVRSLYNRFDVLAAIRVAESSEDGDLAFSTDTTTVELLDLGLLWQPTHRNGAFSSLGATFSSNFEDNPDRDKNDAVKAKLILDYTYLQPFGNNWFAQLGINLAFSEDPLPDVERYRLGGPDNVRAYPATEVAGDEGQLYRFDLGKRINLGPRTNLIARVFYDHGTVERILPFPGEEDEEELSGYGIGALFEFGIHHSLDLMVAEPTSDFDSSDGEDTRFWINYALRI